MTPYFICGLPRSQTAWIANYLTFEDSFCFHDALKDCQDGISRLRGIMEAVGASYVGNSDPANALVQDGLIKEFPNAKWVVIDRPFSEVRRAVDALGMDSSRLHYLQGKIEELRLKVSPLVVPHGALHESIKDIAKFVDPGFRYCEARHKMLVHLNVQTDVSWAKEQIATRGEGIAKQFEPVNLSQDCKEFLDLMKELCSPDPYAFIWYQQLINVALAWDHIIDGDAQDPQAFDAAMYAVTTDWMINPFVKKYADYLAPTIASATSSWKHSYTEGASKDNAYRIYSDVAGAIAFVLGGNKRVVEFMPRVRALVDKLCQEDEIRDGGRK